MSGQKKPAGSGGAAGGRVTADGPFERTHDDRSTQRLILPMRKETARAIVKDGYEKEMEYWLNKPFAYATILRDPDGNVRYHLSEPHLSSYEEEVRKDLRSNLVDQLLYRIPRDPDQDKEKIFEEKARETLDRLTGVDIREGVFQKILYYLKRDLLDMERIDALREDPYLEELENNGDDLQLFVEHRDYAEIPTNLVWDDEELRPFVKRIAEMSGQDISNANPLQGTALPDGSRAQLALDEVAPRGDNFTIRLFPDDPFTLVDLIKLGTCSVEQLAYLWLLIEYNHSGMVVGGTSSGKTTMLNALCMFLPPGDRLISMEDTRELKIPKDNWVPLMTREGYGSGDEEVGMYDLLRAGLRLNPTYMTVGEVRGEEAYDLFQAASTGHTTMSTLHADSKEAFRNRLTSAPMNVPKQNIAEMSWVTIQTQTDVGGEEVRRTKEVHEITGYNQKRDELSTRRVYHRDPREDKLKGDNDSYFLSQLEEEGIDARKEGANRQKVLRYLVQNDIDDYDAVATVTRAYMISPEKVVAQVENDNLDLVALEEIESDE